MSGRSAAYDMGVMGYFPSLAADLLFEKSRDGGLESKATKQACLNRPNEVCTNRPSPSSKDEVSRNIVGVTEVVPTDVDIH